MDQLGDLVQWNIFKIMTAYCQITCTIPWLPCEQLPYPPEYSRTSRMRQRDKSDLPLPVLSYKYFLLQYSFSILSFYSPKSTFLAAASLEDSENKDLLQQPSKPSISPSLKKEWPSTSTSPRSVYHPFFFSYFCCTPVLLRFLLLSTPFLFVLPFTPKNF